MSWDPLQAEDDRFEDEDPFLDEGVHTYSWERFSQNGDANEGWGHATPVSGRRRRRRYDGDAG